MRTAFAFALSVAVMAGQQAPPRPSSVLSGRRAFTVGDEMAMRSLVDVAIAPDGLTVAYVVSTPSLPRNEHESALFVVPTGGGPSRQLARTLHIFNTPTPRPQLRWSPDSTRVALLGATADGPQVFAVTPASDATQPLTHAHEGVAGYEWSPDGRSLAYLTRDPAPEEEQRQRNDKSFVIRADAPDRPARLTVVSLDAGAKPATVTPPNLFVDGFSWLPDGRSIVYSAAPRT